VGSQQVIVEAIPQCAPMKRFARYRTEIDAAIQSVLDGMHAVLGPQVESFESEFAAYCGARHAVGVASGTDALLLALRAAGIGPQDEVILPSLTAAGTAQAVLLSGATPVYADIDPKSRCMDLNAVRAAIGSRTAAVILVHLYGYPGDCEGFATLARDKGLFFLEDCAHAHGAEIKGRKAGTFGHAAAFSFYPTKNLGCLGDGGAVLTSDEALARRVRMLRVHGWKDEARVSEWVAGNSRLDEVQAAILRVLLRHLDEGNLERREIAENYLSKLAGAVSVPLKSEGAVWHQFAIGCERRDRVAARLAADGIGTAVHYSPPLHLQPALAGGKRAPLSETEYLAARVLSLPIQPEAVGGNISRIVDAVSEAVRS
jgi:dTDP-4-amino-4,6-dideoxygalactose transaminase